MKLRREWTAEEDATLRDLAQKISPQRIGVRLKRSKSAIRSRALHLGVELEHTPAIVKRRIKLANDIYGAEL